MSDPQLLLRRVVPEFEGLQLGDRRLEDRVRKTAEALCLDPQASVLRAARSDAEAEAIYRLLRNQRVSMGAVLEPHMVHTAQRCGELETVLVVHDTTEFAFSGEEREGLGRLRGKQSQGFLFHASLAVEVDSRQPLGLIGAKVWVRDETRTSVVQGRNGKRKASARDYQRMPSKESDRWGEQVLSSAERLRSAKQVVHVADREADNYAFLATMHAGQHDFVVRLARNRKAHRPQSDAVEGIVDIAAQATGCARVEVPIARRPPNGAPRAKKTFAERDARLAKLEFAATKAEIRCPAHAKGLPETLPVHVVHVRELDVSGAYHPIEWMLLTSLPVDTEADVRRVVEIYRARWLVEEFFKALKTGCEMERRELESLETLTNILAICIPIAYQLLALRHLARSKPQAPARLLFSEAQLAILHAKAKTPADPTAHEALVGVARLGGHWVPFERKLPGWEVLGRGLERLLTYEQGWLIRDEM